MKHTPYKYRLHYLLRNLAVEDYEIAMSFLPEFCKIHPRTFQTWIYLKEDEPQNIPADSLVKFAQFFEVEVMEMFAAPPSRDLMIAQFNNLRTTKFPNHVYSQKFSDKPDNL